MWKLCVLANSNSVIELQQSAGAASEVEVKLEADVAALECSKLQSLRKLIDKCDASKAVKTELRTRLVCYGTA
eukprot:2297-Heterococcus_DN1.PRE.1